MFSSQQNPLYNEGCPKSNIYPDMTKKCQQVRRERKKIPALPLFVSIQGPRNAVMPVKLFQVTQAKMTRPGGGTANAL